MAVCGKCGHDIGDNADVESACPHTRPPRHSLSQVMDTGSFMVPARRNIILVWTVATALLAIAGWTAYALLGR